MATVPENLDKIMKARYGEEVRGAICDSIKSIYDYTADDRIDNSIMDLATKTYSGHSVLGFGTMDKRIVDSVMNPNFCTFGSFINNSGQIIPASTDVAVISNYIDLIIEDDVDGVYIITASRRYDTRIVGLYDANKIPLGVYDEFDGPINAPTDMISVPQVFDNWIVSKSSILLKYPNARYVRFGSYSNKLHEVPLRLEVIETNQINNIGQYIKYFDDNLTDFIDDRYSIGQQIFDKNQFTISKKFISYDGAERSDNNSNCTGAISISKLPDVFHVKLGIGYDTRAIHVYDYFGNHIGTYDHYDVFKNIGRTEAVDMFVYKTKLFALYPDARFIRFCNYAINVSLNDVSIDEAVKKDPVLQHGNVLYDKKYVICGDSFSAELDSNNVHPYGKFIADRNNMAYLNLALAGTTMSADVRSDNFCQYQYKKVPKDADYITLCYGLNEESKIPDHIGTKGSTELDTLWGAWNFSLKYLIKNMPYAKIGIIIADAWISQTMHDTLVEIAKWWGIPYLDLKGDPQVPMGLGGRLPLGSVSSEAQELRQNAFEASDSDTHPNEKAHEYRSTIIENFLRSL